ncbi:TorF family putative porin [Pontibacterium granulatum]|uniref:TorF family putative porin n=1 Tax=Pontibacterium granulatum TaxID=2036029 RepID=UPI002499D6F4|nr:TorF family putative porin [Pontibacterium granulatum]MDI3324551.1 TorF family putative porin [Pontibacterium granulatum]
MKLTWLAPAALLAASVSAQAAEVSGSVTMTNDYRFRGVSQTSGDPAVQASIDAGFDNGVYAGIWGSNVNFGDSDNANLEVDYYAGKYGDLTENIGYDATLYYFQYHGYTDGTDIDFFELDLRLSYKDFTALYAYAPDYINSDQDYHYVALDYSTGITDVVNLDLHAGYTFGEYYEDLDAEYTDYSIGISGSAAGLDLSVAYLFNDVNGSKTDDLDDNTVVFSVSRTF